MSVLTPAILKGGINQQEWQQTDAAQSYMQGTVLHEWGGEGGVTGRDGPTVIALRGGSLGTPHTGLSCTQIKHLHEPEGRHNKLELQHFQRIAIKGQSDTLDSNDDGGNKHDKRCRQTDIVVRSTASISCKYGAATKSRDGIKPAGENPGHLTLRSPPGDGDSGLILGAHDSVKPAAESLGQQMLRNPPGDTQTGTQKHNDASPVYFFTKYYFKYQ